MLYNGNPLGVAQDALQLVCVSAATRIFLHQFLYGRLQSELCPLPTQRQQHPLPLCSHQSNKILETLE